VREYLILAASLGGSAETCPATMSDRILQLIFSPSPEIGQGSEFLTVLSNESGTLTGISGIACREFYAEGYEEIGRDLCLWWYRQFSQPDEEGICLHDLFEWAGISVLWFTDVPVLHPEFGSFPRLMIAIQALSLFERGEVMSVRIFGNEPALAGLFRANGVPCDLHSPPSQPVSSSGLKGKLIDGLTRFYRWYAEGKALRLRFLHQHHAEQRETLFYSTYLNEWRIPGDGKHRYHADFLEELLEAGHIKEVRPIVFGPPPSRGDATAWRAFVAHSLGTMKGFYGPGFTSLRVMMKAKQWEHRLRARLERWRNHAPPGFGWWGKWDFRDFLDAQMNRTMRSAAPLVVRYEALRTALSRAHPKALLLKDEVYSEGRLLISVARSAGVRTLSTQHGSIYPTHWCYVMDREARGTARPPLPDVFGVYGEAVKRMLVEKGGMPENLLRVIGARRFRLLRNAQVSPEIKAFAGTVDKVVLLAGQMHQDMPTLYDWCFLAARELPALRFVIKPHPRDITRIEALEERCQEQPNTLFFRGPVEGVFPAALVTVSSHSTVLLESVWLGIPAVSVQMSGETPAEWQTGAGILHVVQTYADLRDSLSRAVSRTLVDDSARAKADGYLEGFLGRNLCEDSDALRGLL
jgi:hypothetical protein